ncbi:MAG: metal-dependent hydrolase [Myxococcales bacterium]|nr:MAG: metal-dependent hydrolase [Myxococcales bacterium]
MQPHHASERPVRIRPFRRGFAGVSRHWFGGNAVATHLVNGLNLVFPSGERFFIQSVRHYEARITDPVLRQQIRGFYAQEGHHGHAHELFFEALRQQGYAIDGPLRFVDALLHRVAPRVMPPALRLSITVALEHYTALMAELPFDHPYFERIDPAVRELLLWHAAEEIEHKAVAFDVLRTVAPGHALRLAGFAVATAFLLPIWGTLTLSLLAHDDLPLGRLVAELRELAGERFVVELFADVLREYLPADFHPLQRDSYPRVVEFLSRFEAATPARWPS